MNARRGRLAKSSKVCLPRLGKTVSRASDQKSEYQSGPKEPVDRLNVKAGSND
jgi:hypothetical protein